MLNSLNWSTSIYDMTSNNFIYKISGNYPNGCIFRLRGNNQITDNMAAYPSFNIGHANEVQQYFGHLPLGEFDILINVSSQYTKLAGNNRMNVMLITRDIAAVKASDFEFLVYPPGTTF